MADYSEKVYWLALIQKSKLKLNLVKPIILRWAVSEGRSLADLFDLSPLELSTTFGLPDDDAERMLSISSQLDTQATELEQWQAQKLEPLLVTDPRYPKRLKYTLPPSKQPLVLWVRGDTNLLNQPGVTMLGYHGSEKNIAAFISKLMTTLEAESIGLVSGYSRGLDRETFDMMLATESGTTVAMLPMGLSAFAKTTRKLDAAVEAGRTVLVSPFPPDTGYQEKLADARNLLIDHLTLALLIPDSDAESQERAAAAIERGLPVFVKENTAGNRELLDRGALLLTDAGEVLDWVQQAMVDDAMLEPEDEKLSAEELAAAPLSVTAPVAPEVSDEDYSLRGEEVPPIDSEEAMELLSLGGAIPEVLRRRLDKSDDDEE